MSELARVSVLMGVVFAVMYVPFLASPRRTLSQLKAFPRNRWAGWLLSAAGIVWSARLVWLCNLGWFEPYRSWIYLLTPASWLIIVCFMDELLAVRALGGLLILVPAPLLDAARWNDSSLRLVVVVLAYLMAVKGIALVLSPYLFRKGVEALLKADAIGRAGGVIGFAIGCVLILLGLLVY